MRDQEIKCTSAPISDAFFINSTPFFHFKVTNKSHGINHFICWTSCDKYFFQKRQFFNYRFFKNSKINSGSSSRPLPCIPLAKTSSRFNTVITPVF